MYNKSVMKKLHAKGEELQDAVIQSNNLIQELLELCDQYLKSLETLMEEASNV